MTRRKPRIYPHPDGHTVSIGFSDTQDTLLSLNGGPEAHGDAACLAEWVGAVAESLTGTSGEQTTETGAEGPSNPEGLAEGWSYEYRAVWDDGLSRSAWRPSFKDTAGLVDDLDLTFIERRLVGSVERVTEDQLGNGQ